MRKLTNQLKRLVQIQWIFAKQGMDRVVLSLHIFSPWFFLNYLNPWNWWRDPAFDRAVAIRKTLEDLGPIFVKFGQALSTRQDLIPVDIAVELARLQDAVPPFPSDQARRLIEAELGDSITNLFSEFDSEPLASASIAQVHAARLLDGRAVVVKVLRPNIRQQIEQDLQLMYTFARTLEKYSLRGRLLRASDIVAEFEKTLIHELDLLREAANASQLRHNFMDSPMLYIPEIYWPYSKEKVIVMERIYGIPIANTDQLRAAGFDLKKLAERGVEIFFTQVFRDCFFHADMHPGNIFVALDNPQDPQYIAVDFGILGSLSEDDKYYIARNFLAFFQRDYRLVAELHLESGWIPKETRIEEFEAAIRTVCEPIFARPLQDISFAQLIMRLIQTGRQFRMNIQPQLILLQKTLFAVEGLGRQLYPQLDLWRTAKPFLERWLQEQVSFTMFRRQVGKYAPALLRQMPMLPSLLHDVLTLTKQQLTPAEQTAQTQSLVSVKKGSFVAGMGCTLFGIGIATWIFSESLALAPWVSTSLIASSALLLAIAWWRG